jgi:multidrug efflux pump subunit AcrA (membrane-fusion protein)
MARRQGRWQRSSASGVSITRSAPRQIDIGNIIHPTDPNGLVVVTQLEPISVIFTLPETNLPQIQQHLANGALKVEAYSQDNTMKLDEGTLDFIISGRAR